MSSFYKLARPALFKMDAEDAHSMTINALKTGLVPLCAAPTPHLKQTVFGIEFPNPVGLAAGFDKNADVIAPMLKMGFGYVEVGTVTPKPQEGNPRPRIFRDPAHGAVINRMGFPNKGLAIFKSNLEAFRKNHGMQPVVGVNIGMNKDQTDPAADYTLLISELANLASYLSVNISSPNTPGLRNLQDKEHLAPLLDTLIKTREATDNDKYTPLLVKLAPDLNDDQQHDIAAVLKNSGIDGVILTNTTLARPDHLNDNFKAEKGGLSGAPLTDSSTTIIRNFNSELQGALPIIGIGGISSAKDAQDKISAGASLIQLYTGLIYEGPGLPAKICKGLTKAA